MRSRCPYAPVHGRPRRGASGRPAQDLRGGRCRGRGARRRERRARRGRVHRDHGAVGLREVDPAALPRRARHADRADRSSSATSTSRQLNDKRLTELRRDKVGFVFQAFNLVPTLTAAREHHAAARHRRPDVDEAWFDEVVATIGLRRPAHTPPEPALRWTAAARRRRARAGLPSGDRVRRRADRATSTRSPGAELLGFLRAAVKDHGQTIVMVTHDANAASYADRVDLPGGRQRRRRDARSHRRPRPRPPEVPGGLTAVPRDPQEPPGAQAASRRSRRSRSCSAWGSSPARSCSPTR